MSPINPDAPIYPEKDVALIPNYEEPYNPNDYPQAGTPPQQLDPDIDWQPVDIDLLPGVPGQRGATGPQGPQGIQGIQGLSGVVNVTSPITNSGTISAANIGIDQTLLSLSKSQVGLGNVDNTSDINKPISTATQTALNLKLDSSTAASTYLTQLNAASTYLTISNASSTYLTQSTASSTYLTQSNAASTYATPGYVTTAINNLIGAAPATLDTLNELAAALNNDASFSVTVTNSLAGKANLTGGNTFTGAQNITGSNAAITALKVVPAASPSTDIFQIRNSADNANLFSIGSGGAITTASALTVNGLASFNANISAFGTSQLWANQQLSLGVRNGVNYAGNLVQYSLNDTAVTGGVSARGLLFAGSTGFENNPTYNLSATNPFLTSSTAIFTVSTVQTYNPFAVGQKIIISGASQAQYNGAWISTAVGGSSGAWTVTIVAGGTTTPFTDGGAITATGTIALEPAGFFKQPSPGAVGLVIKGAGISSTATDIFRYVNSNGSVQTYITAAGDITAPAISAIWSITSSAQDVAVNAMRARTSIASGYRANLQTWESSTTVLAGVNATGQIFTGRTSTISGATTATTAASASSTTVATFTVGTVSTVNPYAVGQVVTTAGFTAQTYFNSSSQTSGTFYVTGIGGSSGAWTITVLGSGFTVGSATVQGTITIPAQVSVTPYSAGTVGQIIRGAASQTANLQEWQDSAGTRQGYVSSGGNSIIFPGVYANYELYVQSGGSSVLPLRVRAAASQTANLTEWQNSSGTVLGGRNANAQIYTGSTAPLTSSIGGTIQSIATGANPLVTMASNHNLVAGDLVTLSGTTGGTYDGTFVVSASTPASTTFNITTSLTAGQAAAGGTVVVPAQTSIVARSGATVALNVRGASLQTASFMEVQNSSATTLLRVNTSGYVVAPLGLIGGGSTQSTNASSVLANNTMYPTATGQIGLAVRGLLNQSANLQEWQDSAGTVHSGINASGFFFVGGASSPGGQIGIQTEAATNRGMVIKGSASQSANLQEWQNSAGTVLSRITENGAIMAPNFWDSRMQGTSAGIALQSSGAAVPTAIFRGAASQTANLQEWQDSSGTILSRISSTGSLQSVGANFQTTGFGAILNVGTGSAANIGQIIRGVASQSGDLQQWQDSSATVLAGITSGGRGYFSDGITSYVVRGSDGLTAIRMDGGRSVQIGSSTVSYGGGAGVLGIANATTVPTSNPTGGGILFVDTGALRYIGTSGLAQTIVAADGSGNLTGIPQISRTTSYTLALADAGKHVYFTATGQTLTIPANASVAFPIGTSITVVNAAGVSTSIAITTDTLILAGAGTTGTRTLAANGMATLLKITATSWIASGNGLT